MTLFQIDPGLAEACGDSPGLVCEWVYDLTSNEDLAEFVAEVGRQVSAFNEKIEAGDAENPVIQRLMAAYRSVFLDVRRSEDPGCFSAVADFHSATRHWP